MKFIVKFVKSIILVIIAYFIGERFYSMIIDPFARIYSARPLIAAVTIAIFVAPAAVIAEKIIKSK